MPSKKNNSIFEYELNKIFKIMKNLKYIIIVIFIIQIFLNTASTDAEDSPVPFIINKDTNFWQESSNYPGVLKGIEIKNSFPDKQWWLQFNDPILNCYIDQAISANQNIKIALAHIEEANAQTGKVFGSEFPQIFLRDIFFRVKGSKTFLVPQAADSSVQSSSFLAGGTQNLFILPLTAQYELDYLGKNHSITKAARKEAEKFKFDYESALISITSDVATIYLNLIKTDKLLKLQCALLQNQEKSLKLRQSLFSEGLISLDDVLVNQEAISLIKSNIADIKKLQGTLVHQLCILMGKPPTVESCLTRTEIDKISINRDIQIGDPSLLIVRRPDILASEAQLEAAGINVSVARKELLPSFSILGAFGYSTANLDKFFNWNSNTSAIGTSISQALFTGGSKIANLKLNKAKYKEAVQVYQKSILNAFKEVEDSLSTINASIIQYIQAEDDIANSEQQLFLTSDRYKEGINSCLDFLNSEQQLINFKQNLVQKKGEILINKISLYKALGGGY
ncbi:MAG: efflux transporter outer membrane subunit [Candidatus Gastranaerophilales bacterium]|nr:efflux transporter outer membrane subunit [Candidatus Gastranaerophilales bacterium]